MVGAVPGASRHRQRGQHQRETLLRAPTATSRAPSQRQWSAVCRPEQARGGRVAASLVDSLTELDEPPPRGQRAPISLHIELDRRHAAGDDRTNSLPGQPQLPQIPSFSNSVGLHTKPGVSSCRVRRSHCSRDWRGRLWIDAETHHLLRIEINITEESQPAFSACSRMCTRAAPWCTSSIR